MRLNPIRWARNAWKAASRRLWSSAPTSTTPESDVAWQTRQFRYYATNQPYSSPLNISHGNLTGETWEMRQGYREWSIKEPALKGALLTKCLAVCQLDPQLIPCDKTQKEDRAAAEWVKYSVQNSDEGFPGLIFNMLFPGTVDGFSVVEKVFGKVDARDSRYAGWWTLKSGASIDTNLTRFRLDTYRQVIGVYSLAGAQGAVEMPPSDYLIFTHLKIFENPYGNSDCRAVVRACRLIESAIRLRHILLTNYSGPFLKAMTGDTAARAMLAEQLENARANGWIILPEGSELEVLNLATANLDVFRSTIEDYRQEIVQGIQGAYLQLLEGGISDGRGNTQVHKTISELFQWWLATWVCQVINKQLIPDLIVPNFGNRVGFPRLQLGGIDESAITAALARFKAGQDLGVKLKTSQVMEVGGFESPETPEDTLTPPAAQQQQSGGNQPPDPFGGFGGNGQPPDKPDNNVPFAHVGRTTRFADDPMTVARFFHTLPSAEVFEFDVDTYEFVEWRPYTNPRTHKSGWISSNGLVRYANPVKAEEKKKADRATSTEAIKTAIDRPAALTDAHVDALHQHLKTLTKPQVKEFARTLGHRVSKTKAELAARLVEHIVAGRGNPAHVGTPAAPTPPVQPTPAPPTTRRRTATIADVNAYLNASGGGNAFLSRPEAERQKIADRIGADLRSMQNHALAHPHPSSAPAAPAPTSPAATPSVPAPAQPTALPRGHVAIPGGSVAVTYVGPRDLFKRHATELFGRDPDTATLAQGANAADGAKVSISSDPGRYGRGTEIRVESNKQGSYTASRTFHKGRDGKTVVHNNYFRIQFTQKPGTDGTKKEHWERSDPTVPDGMTLFSRQTEALSKMGVARIETHAARADSVNPNYGMNGYYTWPRFGYDADLKDVRNEYYSKLTPALKALVDSNPVGSKHTASVLSLMSTKEGRDWWKKNGADLFHAEFDLTPGSLSQRTLKAYQDARASGDRD